MSAITEITESEVIEGTWEEIARQAPKFDGHRLRVVILPAADPDVASARLEALNAWLTLPRPAIPALPDDSRGAIYDGEDEDRG